MQLHILVVEDKDSHYNIVADFIENICEGWPEQPKITRFGQKLLGMSPVSQPKKASALVQEIQQYIGQLEDREQLLVVWDLFIDTYDVVLDAMLKEYWFQTTGTWKGDQPIILFTVSSENYRETTRYNRMLIPKNPRGLDETFLILNAHLQNWIRHLMLGEPLT